MAPLEEVLEALAVLPPVPAAKTNAVEAAAVAPAPERFRGQYIRRGDNTAAAAVATVVVAAPASGPAAVAAVLAPAAPTAPAAPAAAGVSPFSRNARLPPYQHRYQAPKVPGI